jgi:hypothetical protein
VSVGLIDGSIVVEELIVVDEDVRVDCDVLIAASTARLRGRTRRAQLCRAGAKWGMFSGRAVRDTTVPLVFRRKERRRRSCLFLCKSKEI